MWPGFSRSACGYCTGEFVAKQHLCVLTDSRLSVASAVLDSTFARANEPVSCCTLAPFARSLARYFAVPNYFPDGAEFFTSPRLEMCPRCWIHQDLLFMLKQIATKPESCNLQQIMELCLPQLRRWRIVRELQGPPPPTDAPSSILATIKASGDYSEAERMLEYNSVGRDVYNCLPFDSTFDSSPIQGRVQCGHS